MNSCPKCGAEFPHAIRICPNDGTVLEEQVKTDARLGTTLDGKYKLESALGQGGMGTIYRATHLMLDKPVALKLINAELVSSPDIIRRFQREARAASNLNHPNIAAAYDLGQTSDGTLYIAMELVNGPSLKDVIRSTGPLHSARIGRILRQVASALAVAHRHNIIHRDLKPHNIMLATTAAGGEVAKLLDFGIAKTFDDAQTQLTATGFVLGTPQYMSPEQAAGRPIDGRSDLYSLGIILFEMMVGEVPFNDPSTPAVLVKHLTEPAPSPSLRRPDLPILPALEAVALRCLEKDPAARYQTADEFASALDLALGVTGSTAAIDEIPPTVIVPSPSAPTATAPAVGATMNAPAATVIAPTSGNKTAQVFSPVIPPAATLPPTAAATAPSAPVVSPAPVAPAAATSGAPLVAPPSSSTAPVPAVIAAPPAPLSMPSPAAAAAVSDVRPSSSLGRNAIIVGAFVLLLITVGAYAAMSGLLGGGDDAAQTLASGESALTPPAPPPAPPADTTAAPMEPPASVPPGGTSTPSGAARSSASPSTPSLPAVPSGSRARGAVPPAGSAATGAQPAATTPPPAPTAPPAQAANPMVVFRCAGPAPVCGSLRTSMGNALDAASIVSVQDPSKADLLVEAKVTEVDSRTEQMFGTTFVVRTYSVELSGEARESSRAVPMPNSTTFSYDARVGQEKLDGQTRVIAASAAERIRSFWKNRED